MTTITCYAEPNYSGVMATICTDQPNLTDTFPNGVGSATVSPPGGVVTLYAEINYKGEHKDFPPDFLPGFKSLKIKK